MEFNEEYYSKAIRGELQRHDLYLQACDHKEHLEFHIKGNFLNTFVNTQLSQQNAAAGANVSTPNKYFNRIVLSQRPSESPVIKGYRLMQSRAYTKSVIDKPINSFKKIVKSDDFKISYKEKSDLETYCENNFPIYKSIENYAYMTLIEKLMSDSNSWIVCAPLFLLNIPKDFFESDNYIKPNDEVQPFPFVIPCQNIINFEIDNYITFESVQASPYIKDKKGKIIITVTKEKYIIACEKEKGFYLKEIEHNINLLPAWLIGGVNKSDNVFTQYYESFISSMLPFLDAVANDFCNLDAEKVLHIFSTMYFHQTQSCKACQGTGKVKREGGQVIKCDVCEGRGTPAFSPFSHFEILPTGNLQKEFTSPTPPIGYIQKDTKILEVIRTEIEKNTYSALASLNMEFLYNEPISGTSGFKTSLDREEANVFIYSIAYHLIENIIKPIYFFINELRYSKLITDKTKRYAQLPTIPVPKDFSLILPKDATDNLIKIQSSNVSPLIKSITEYNYIVSEYSEQPELRERLKCINELNPLPNLSIADIETCLNANLCTKQQGYAAIHLSAFIQKQEQINKEFFELDFEAKQKLLYEFVDEIIAKQQSEVDTSVNNFAEQNNSFNKWR